MVAYDEAGPLNGLVWPILISVSVAPVSYFFCAEADETDSASVSAVADARWKNPFLISMRSSLIYWDFADGLVRSTKTRNDPPSLAGIVAERSLQCKASAAEKVSDSMSTKVGLTWDWPDAANRRPAPRKGDAGSSVLLHQDP